MRARAFGMPVVVWSRRSHGGEKAPGRSARAERLAQPRREVAGAAADVLSVHVALTPETRGLVGAASSRR